MKPRTRCVVCRSREGATSAEVVVGALIVAVRMSLDEQPEVSGLGRDALEGAMGSLCAVCLDRVERAAREGKAVLS